jgi:dihydrolipoamide dehydrogenase
MKNVDVLILGAGTAGMSAYRAAKAHTSSVAIVESGEYGTICAREGCMPSKLMIAAADSAHRVRNANLFGVLPSEIAIDSRTLFGRVRSERDRFVGFVKNSVNEWPAEDRIIGTAKLVDKRRALIDGKHHIEANRIVVATGSSAVVPSEWVEQLGDRLLTAKSVFELDAVPASIAVIGAGPIAIELGQSLSRLGTQVTVFDRGSRFCGISDPVVEEKARMVVGGEIRISRPATIERFDHRAHEAIVHWHQNGTLHCESFEYVLVAIGRRPNLDEVGIQHLDLPRNALGGLDWSPRTMEVGNSGVFIAGDASGERMLLHEAADHGRIAGDNAGRYPDVRNRPRRTHLAIAFSDPQVALVGASYRELVESQESFGIGEVDFSDQGRSRVMGVNQGLLRVYGSRVTGKFLGAEMIAPSAEHLGHLLAWALHAGMSVQEMLDAPYYHPVIEEGVRTALRNLRRDLRMGPPPVEHCIDCGPGA